ncbi:hypothetical protein APUTEX25_001293, partial [Auxenochlorella protothecoides]
IVAELDPFASALDLEEHHFRDGREAGMQEGKAAGYAEGRAMGVEQGFRISYEVAFYSGCLSQWHTAGEHGGRLKLNPRVLRHMALLEDLVRSFPWSDAQDPNLHQLVEAMRGRFKTLVTMLGLGDAYGIAHAADESLSF